MPPALVASDVFQPVDDQFETIATFDGTGLFTSGVYILSLNFNITVSGETIEAIFNRWVTGDLTFQPVTGSWPGGDSTVTGAEFGPIVISEAELAALVKPTIALRIADFVSGEVRYSLIRVA